MRVMFIVNNLGVVEPFGPMILSAILRQRGHVTTLGILQKEDVMEKIFSWKPDILAYSMMTVDMEDMKVFNDSLREKAKIFTLLGGVHPTFDRSCIDDPGIDAICVGEGDEAIVDVVERLENGGNLTGIPNILTSSGSPLILRNLVKDLDAIPFMDRELIYSYPEMANFGIKGIWTSRGCAFPCPYCHNNRYNELVKDKGKAVRRRSVDSIIKEVKELVADYRVDFVRVQDDGFVYKVDDWLKEFAEKWSSEIAIPFYCSVRADVIKEDTVFYLKKAGCFSVSMSIEAADNDVRNRMLRRKVTRQQLENAIEIFKKSKINVYTNTILGLPFTSFKHDIDSLDFNIKVQPAMADFTIFMPFPGTDLGDYCREVGAYIPDANPIDYGLKNISPLNCFSDKEKEAQYNLCELAICAVRFPWLRNLIVNHLVRWRPNRLFFLVHYLFQIIAYGRKIFYFRHSFGEYFGLVAKTFKQYLFDCTKQKKDKKSISKNKGAEENKRFSDYTIRAVELEKCMKAMEGAGLHVGLNKNKMETLCQT